MLKTGFIAHIPPQVALVSQCSLPGSLTPPSGQCGRNFQLLALAYPVFRKYFTIYSFVSFMQLDSSRISYPGGDGSDWELCQSDQSPSRYDIPSSALVSSIWKSETRVDTYYTACTWVVSSPVWAAVLTVPRFQKRKISRLRRSIVR